MQKELAPPPGEDENTGLEKAVADQRLLARQAAEKRKVQRLSEKKQSALENLGQAISELSIMSEETSSSMSELEVTFVEIAASAVQSSEAAEKSKVAVENIMAASEAAKLNTQVSLEKNEATQNLVTRVLEGITALIDGINNTVTTGSETAKLLETLEKQTLGIEGTISDIVQTSEEINLLALNAAIESSRVGERGAGFSVVADEIMRLAEKTKEIGSQITDAFQAIRNAVNVISGDLTEMVAQAEQDAGKANEIVAYLELAGEDMEVFRKGSEEIRDLADAQFAETATILENTNQIWEGAAQTATATQQASAALQEQSSGLEAIVRTLEDIGEQVETIEQEKYTEVAVEELATGAEELSATIRESSAAMQQVTSALDQIAQTGIHQSSATEDNSSRAKVVENAAKKISDNAQVHMEKATNLQELLGNIDSASTTMMERILVTASINIESAKKVRALNVEMSALERVLGKLSMTNILTSMIAVSGRIESSRAGEHGAGLAKVSTDIRDLVEQSSDRIPEIERMVRLIRDTITSIASSVEQTGNRVLQESENIKRNTTDLGQVEDDIAEVLKGVKNIKTAVDESLAAIEEIKNNVDDTVQAAEQASTACQQAASAAAQQNQALQVMANAAAEIAEQADEL